MQTFRSFDIMGPRMIGPSSSHTAGAARLAHVAWQIAGRDVKSAALILYGSFAKTGSGHGTDKALLAGVLGLSPEDERLRYSRLLAQEAGIEYTFEFCDEAPQDYANMARIIITGHDGHITNVLGASIGGGNILVTQINGLEVAFTGEYPTLIVSHRDTPGMISAVTGLLAQKGVNIAGMRVYRDGRGLKAYMVIETDARIDDETLKEIQHMQNVNRICSVSNE
ncbi:MAG: L-serine ammonia-lyase, iron-sulfur-dependent subunit beta [Clostridia bacterium]|nr:L-serine ammonia-lyase, iron-sulfur-dependent subunit beta [Clostridia bacterium]